MPRFKSITFDQNGPKIKLCCKRCSSVVGSTPRPPNPGAYLRGSHWAIGPLGPQDCKLHRKVSKIEAWPTLCKLFIRFDYTTGMFLAFLPGFGFELGLKASEDLFIFFLEITCFLAEKPFEFPILAEKSFSISVKIFFFLQITCFWAGKPFEFPILAEKSFSILVKTFFFLEITCSWAEKPLFRGAEKFRSLLFSNILKFLAPPFQNPAYATAQTNPQPLQISCYKPDAKYPMLLALSDVEPRFQKLLKRKVNKCWVSKFPFFFSFCSYLDGSQLFLQIGFLHEFGSQKKMIEKHCLRNFKFL